MKYTDKNSIVSFRMSEWKCQPCLYGKYFKVLFWTDQEPEVLEQLSAQIQGWA